MRPVRQEIESDIQSSYLSFAFKTVIVALIIEAVSLPPAVLTFGHAGPTGNFAEIGYVGFLINLFGFVVAARFASYDSMLGFSLWVLAIQVFFITGLSLTIRWIVSRRRT
jgi:hypothetical protein